MEVIVGTAGHIDHGKTALIKALTGTDADRLPEEKRRGITVDLGFAEMTAGDIHFGFVDVPGHERFVKNMLAGASGIDLVMLVIAADEGVMPQTREHFDICRLLGVSSGVVVLTKTDLVDAETLELAKLDAAELVYGSFLEDAAVVGVSSKTSAGLDELREALVAEARALARAIDDRSLSVSPLLTRGPAQRRRRDDFVTRLPIDRSFSMKGFGAVVTGTLASGEIVEGSELELFPAGIKARVRGLQAHGKSVRTATAGQRVAVNLGGIDHSKVTRGMVLAEPNMLQPTQVVDAEVEVLRSAPKTMRSRQRVRVHIGTVEALARIEILNETGSIAAGDQDLIQIRLETPIIAVPGERFIIRSYSPQHTIAGGQVIDAFAVKHRRKDVAAVREHLHKLLAAAANEAETVRLLVAAAGPKGAAISELQMRTALRPEILRKALDENIASPTIVRSGEDRYITTKEFGALSALALAAISEFHKREPLAKGMSREAIRESAFVHLPLEVFASVISSLEASGNVVLDKDAIRLGSYKAELSTEEALFSDKLLARFTNAGLEVPKLEDALAESIAGTNVPLAEARKLFQIFLDSGEIVKVTDEFYFSRGALDRLVTHLRQFADGGEDRTIDVTKFKEIAGVSRKYAIPLLEYFDRERITQRSGDKRLIM